jgi:hypothetical protein
LSECKEGKGGAREEYSSQDLRLTIRALNQQWPVADDMKANVLKTLISVASGANSRPRDAVAAGKAILLATKINLDAIRLSVEAKEKEDVIEKVADYIETHHENPAGALLQDVCRSDHPG